MSELSDVQARLADVDDRLARLGHTASATLYSDAIGQLRERFERRLNALTGAYDAAHTLARLSSPTELLLQAPGTLAQFAGFQRVLLSTIDSDGLFPFSAYFNTSNDPEIDADLVSDALERLRDSPVRLAPHLVESDVVRRRRAALVANASGNPRAAGRISETIGWASYVVAPVISGAVAIGLLHADRGPNIELGVLDRDVLGEFAAVVSQLHESAYLRRTLVQEREAVRRFLERLNALSISLADTPVTLDGHEEVATPAVRPMVAPGQGLGNSAEDDRLVFSGLLTNRELEVLRLLAEGGTNRTIANALVLSDTTVKFHVNNILRKLHVSNRAEAVARYLSLLGLPSAG